MKEIFEILIKYAFWVIFVIVTIGIFFYIFGAELPVYLIFTFIGLFFYIYSENPLLKFIGGWIGRLSAVLFLISLIYYISIKFFFPENIFEFRFLAIGITFVNEQAKNLGGFILNLFR